MRTTIDIPDPLFRQAKLAAVKRSLSLKEFVADAIRLALAKPVPTKESMDEPPIIMEGHVVPALSNREIGLLFEEEELEKIR